MGIRGELFSTRVQLENRTYFFNVKENRLGDLYLNIVESKNRDSGGFERQSVILFAEDLTAFLAGFDESLQALERQAREKRRSKPAFRERRDYEERHPERERAAKPVEQDGKGAGRQRDDGYSYKKSKPVKVVRRRRSS
jgi:hypothetical protein